MILITIFANCAALAAYEPLPEKDSSEINEGLVRYNLLIHPACGIFIFLTLNIHAAICGFGFNLQKMLSALKWLSCDDL